MFDFLNNHKGVKSIQFILQAANGEIVGRTRLQKIAYLLNLSGCDNSFSFEYKHYGPFSRDVARATDFASLAGVLSEEAKPATWGGTYSVFKSLNTNDFNLDQDLPEVKLVQAAKSVNSIVLELAATAAFLANEREELPWDEVKRRKPKKASDENLQSAKAFYNEIQKIDLEKPLPKLS